MARKTTVIARVLFAAALLNAWGSSSARAQWVQGPAYPPSAIRDGMTPTFDYVGADPTVSPGYDLPIGSWVRYGSQGGIPFYFTKTGFATTDWTLIQSHAAVGASWPLTTSGSPAVRYFCVDGTSGNDLRRGYVDAAAGATLTTCSSVAVKTIAAALARIPRFGNGRSAVMLLTPGTYAEFLDFTGVSGYRYLLRRGSDLTNSTADRLTVGGVVAVAGPNGDSSFTVAGGGTTSTFSVAAGSLGATDADVGWRWRFAANTSTAALQNVSCFINANSASAITCGANLGTAPSAGDTGFVEKPGVIVAAYAEAAGPPAIDLAPSTATFITQTVMQAAGIAVSGTGTGAFSMGAVGSLAQYSFVETTGSTTNQVAVASNLSAGLNISISYADEGGTGRAVGGLRSAGAGTFNCFNATLGPVAFVNASANVTVGVHRTGAIGNGGSYFAKGPTVTSVGSPGSTTQALPLIGTTSASDRATRFVLGPLTLTGSARVANVDVSNSAGSGLVLNGVGSQVTLTSVAGSANTSFGVDMSALVGSNVQVVSATITGTAGDIKLPGTVVATIADLSLTNVVDSSGNNLQGAGGTWVGPGIIVTNKSGGALAVGNVVRDNAVSGEVTKAQADTAAHATGSMCVMVTAPANNSVGYAVCSGTPYVLYDGAPTMGALSYLSPGTAGKLTSTIPPATATNQKLRFSYPTQTSGNTARLQWSHELIPVLADGAL